MKSLAECWIAACNVAQTAVSSVNCVSVTLTVSRHDCCKIANKLLAVLEPYIDACSITVPPPMVNYSTVVDVEQIGANQHPCLSPFGLRCSLLSCCEPRVQRACDHVWR